MPQRILDGDRYEEFLTSATPLTPTTETIESTTNSVLLVAANSARKALCINNQSTATLYISFSNPATAANSFLAMAAGSFLMLDRQLLITNAIYGIWAAANGAAHVTSLSED